MIIMTHCIWNTYTILRNAPGKQLRTVLDIKEDLAQTITFENGKIRLIQNFWRLCNCTFYIAEYIKMSRFHTIGGHLAVVPAPTDVDVIIA